MMEVRIMNDTVILIGILALIIVFIFGIILLNTFLLWAILVLVFGVKVGFWVMFLASFIEFGFWFLVIIIIGLGGD